MKEILKTLALGSPLAVLPLLALSWGSQQAAWMCMWSMAFALYVGCKFLTLRNLPVGSGPGPGMAYFLAWPGMDPVSFLKPGVGEAQSLAARAFPNLLLGGILLWGIAPPLLDRSPLAAGWVGMTGLIFMLHFGLFHLLALLWQRNGYNAEPIMNRPHLATSLADFWGRRWNRAFQCLAKTYVFRPLVPLAGAGPALGVSFLLSGLIHEVVITLPAGGGYGGPTLYFLLQGLGLKLERSFRRRLGPWKMRVWTLSVVLLPAGLLFPSAFVRNIILPMFTAWGIFPSQGVL